MTDKGGAVTGSGGLVIGRGGAVTGTGVVVEGRGPAMTVSIGVWASAARLAAARV